ncbi:hypothetical protein HK405_014284 [Cladochytrium tenue]|nr:hypothetical protein HK405_014284 [Cladochytrium tenue]
MGDIGVTLSKTGSAGSRKSPIMSRFLNTSGQQVGSRTTGQSRSWRKSGLGTTQRQQPQLQQQFYDDDETTSSSSISTSDEEEMYGGYSGGKAWGKQGGRMTSRGGAYGGSGFSGGRQSSARMPRSATYLSSSQRVPTGRSAGRLQGLLDTEDEEYEGYTGGRSGQFPTRRSGSKQRWSRSRGLQQQQGFGLEEQQVFGQQPQYFTSGRKSGKSSRKQRSGRRMGAFEAGGDSSEEETLEILRDLQLDRERDLFQIAVAQDLLRDRRVNRNVHEVCDALSEGRKVPQGELHALLCEDALLDAAVDDVILEILEDKQSNRKADEIIRNLGKGRRHCFRSQDPDEEAEDELHDRHIAKVARKLMTPNAGKKLCKMFGHSTGQHPFEPAQQQQQQQQPLLQQQTQPTSALQQSSGFTSGKRLSSAKTRPISATV